MTVNKNDRKRVRLQPVESSSPCPVNGQTPLGNRNGHGDHTKILSVFKNDESETLIGMMYDEIIKNSDFPFFWLDGFTKLDSNEISEDPSLSWETRSYLTYRLNHFMTQILMGDVFEIGSPEAQFEIMLKSFFNSKSNLECPDPLVMESILHMAFIDLKGSIIIVSEIPLTEDI